LALAQDVGVSTATFMENARAEVLSK